MEKMLVEPSEKEFYKLLAVADYLFGKGAGKNLFPDGIKVMKTKGRIRQVWLGNEMICAIRATDGFIVLGRRGAELLHQAVPPPKLRVVVRKDVAQFVAGGRTVFAKHVVAADPEIRPGEEVLVVDENDRLLATGKAILSGEEMLTFKSGVAVKTRRGFYENKKNSG
ncbi:MAG: PUA domain-containing protein [Candidatus Hadarchaeales archaeon]